MFGKASLILVLGFSSMLLVVGQNYYSFSNRAVDNQVNYFTENVAYNIAVSAANMAANEVFLDPTWTSGFNNVSFQGGKINAIVEIVDQFKNIRRITASGTFAGVTKTVKVTLKPSNFSKFAYYSTTEPAGIWWTSGDTVWGPFHTQDHLRIANSPVFVGKTTSKLNRVNYNNYTSPKFLAGYTDGVDLPLNLNALNDLSTAANQGGKRITGKDTVYLTFNNDKIKVRYKYKDSDVSYNLSSFSPNGVIYVENAIVRLKGSVQGQYTLGVSGSNGKGTVYLDGDLNYKTDPAKDASSTDIMGVVVQQDCWITDNTVNNKDISIQATVYCQSGGFGAEHYDTRPSAGFINLQGGIIQNIRRAVGTFNTHGIGTGFSKNYKYDSRLMFGSPPSFPATGSYEIVSWYE